MNWRVVVRPDAEDDVVEAATWYESRSEGLGVRFSEEVIAVFEALAISRCCTAAGVPARIFAGDILKAFHIESSTKLSKTKRLLLLGLCFTLPDTTESGNDVSEREPVGQHAEGVRLVASGNAPGSATN